MKRLNLLVFGVFLLNFSVFAQIGGATQRGKATHQMDTEGFFAAHSTFPLGATIKVVNTATGEGVNAVISGRIPASTDRIVDLSNEVWDALGLAEGGVVMLVYAPATASRRNPPAAAIEAEKAEQNKKQMARLKAAQPLYQLLILDRTDCEEDADISDLQNIELLYKFLHGGNGYLVALYVSSENGPVFPVMPDNSRILVNMMSTNIVFLRDYTDSAMFKRFVTNREAVSQLRKALE